MIQMIIGHLNLNGMLEKWGETKYRLSDISFSVWATSIVGGHQKIFFGDNMQVFNPQFLFHYSHNQQ